jgi:hypothetical protein
MGEPDALSLQRVERPLRGDRTPPFSGVLDPNRCWSVGSPLIEAGFTTAYAMASAYLSWGIGYPAACLAVRGLLDLTGCCLDPGGEIGGGVAVPVHDQPTTPQRKVRVPNAI